MQLMQLKYSEEITREPPDEPSAVCEQLLG